MVHAKPEEEAQKMDGERKRVCSDADSGGDNRYDGCGRSGLWEGLDPEILALIFVRIPAEQLVGEVQLVCKSWREAIAGPYCWTNIDVEQWCRRCSNTDVSDCLVRRLVRRSRGTVRLLSAYKLGDSGFSYVANCGRYLKVLKIPMSEVTDRIVEKHAESLSKVVFLDISYCLKITCKGLAALGMHCKSLVHLRRNMPPPELQWPAQVASQVDDEEAMVIADTMPGLCELELGYGRFGDCGLDAILTKCQSLTHLDILGCWSVKLEGDLEEKCQSLAFFKSPWDANDDLSVSEDGSDAEEDASVFSPSDSEQSDA
ncbi:F-box protein FBW2-like [Macadamia integrifolia]|uniref:F-box protein FBW2-like n=1 Tax=Macadamia integrifolia TaxID=60698 RepID=UPI001C501554|nr:F-box protein FBW2-like [Macadamia integrifolia]